MKGMRLWLTTQQLVKLSCDLTPGLAGGEVAARITDLSAGVARGGQPRFRGLRTTSNRRTMPTKQSDSSALAALLDGSTAGELTPEIVRHGLKELI